MVGAWTPSTMILLQTAFIFALCGIIHSQEQTYVISGPKSWRVGASETVVVQMFGQQGSIDVAVTLTSYPDKKVKYASQHLTLKPENNYQGIVNLMLQPKDFSKDSKFVYLEAQTTSFTQAEKVPVTYKNGFLFIQTDKPIYTPDQSVKIRVYSMNEELKPALRNVILTFVDPEGVKVDIMESKDLTGIMTFPDFKIPSNPKSGIWTIEAAYASPYTTTTVTAFEVKEYVLPRFFILIEPERNFICFDKFEQFSIKVKANYYYNKKVDQASVYIRYGIIQNDVRRMMPKAIEVQQLIDGETEFIFNSQTAIQELDYTQLEDLDGSYLYITVTVQESSAGHTEESENADVKYVITPYTLQLIATPLFVKPALPFYIKAQVKDTLAKPIGRVPLTMTAQGITEDGEQISFNDDVPDKRVTDRFDGTAMFVLNIPRNIVTLEFQIKTADENLPEDNQAVGSYTASSYKSLSKSYLYIDWATEYKELRVGDYLNVKVFPSSPYLPKLKHYSYLIVSKGKILLSGTVGRVHESTFQSLNIRVTEGMVPSARLLVYYIITGDTTAELVADSVWLDVKENCVNNQNVRVSARKDSFQPGEDMSLTLKAQRNTFVALSAVDVAVYDVARKGGSGLERVLRDLEKSDLGCGAGGGKDNADVFRLAGLTFLTNANTKATENYDTTCNEVVRSKRNADFNAEMQKRANKYADKRLRKCCLDGATCFKTDNDCENGTHRMRRRHGQPCIKAFQDCCAFAQKYLEKASIKDVGIGRMYIRTIFDIDQPQVRSYFPESWLWEVQSVTHIVGLKTFAVKLPDSITTWQIQGIAMSDNGICVADPIKVNVIKDVFLDVPLPYSVVRGEQVEIKVYVYNYKPFPMKGCVTVSVGKEICLFQSYSNSRDISKKTCSIESLPPTSPKAFSFTILPLELGQHTINFTLQGQLTEVVVKTLRVVPEGIKKEKNAAFTLDPQGLYGTIRKRHELSYKIPSNMVPKSKVDRTLSIKGHLLGEVISTVLNSDGINYLTSLPKGSAETDLMRVVPIFYVYHYLETTKNWDILGPETLITKLKMERQMKEGVSSILAFRNSDFSYRVWKDSDPSTWMTAFAMRIFGEVQNYVSVDHMSVCNSLQWLAENCQLKDGSFKDKSNYQPIKLQGTQPKDENEKSVYLTAFVLIAFQKAFHMCPILQIKSSMTLATEFLSKNVANTQSTFTLAITGYALSLTDRTLSGTRHALGLLQREAHIIGVGDPPVYRFWKGTFTKFDATVPNAATAEMVETTAYALMTCLKLGEKYYSNPVIRWLSEQQRYGGGFFSTQDTINALEALTEVALLDKKLALNMFIKVAYRKAGDFQTYLINEKTPLQRPVDVPIPEDLIISTGSTYGIVTANVRTVYHLISTADEICSFELKIDRQSKTVDRESIFDEDTSNTMNLEACAKYKSKDENEFPSSGHAVMEITLVTGLEADEKELLSLTQRVDQYVTDYSITDNSVILHFDSIPSDEFICVSFLVRELYKVGRLSPSTFSVYEFHAPEKHCTIFYNPYGDEKLVKLCKGNECKCMEVECAKLQGKIDTSITGDDRKNTACRADIVYAYKVKILGSETDGSFVKYTAAILDIFKKGAAAVKTNTEVKFIKKKTCTDVNIDTEEQYLVMGKEGFQIRSAFLFRYEYPLDSNTWLEWWPAECYSSDCEKFLAVMEEFSEEILFSGC